jgi:hypothetical protein
MHHSVNPAQSSQVHDLLEFPNGWLTLTADTIVVPQFFVPPIRGLQSRRSGASDMISRCWLAANTLSSVKITAAVRRAD